MGRPALLRSLGVGAVLQVVMVLLWRIVPGLDHREGFLPVTGGVIAMLAGIRFIRRSPGSTIGATVSGGAMAGGGASLLGALAAVIAGAASGAEFETLLVATGTGLVAGTFGATVGRLLPPRRVPA